MGTSHQLEEAKLALSSPAACGPLPGSPQPFHVPLSSTEDEPCAALANCSRDSAGCAQCHMLMTGCSHSFLFCVVLCLYGVLSF